MGTGTNASNVPFAGSTVITALDIGIRDHRNRKRAGRNTNVHPRGESHDEKMWRSADKILCRRIQRLNGTARAGDVLARRNGS